ncbi:putative Heterokaryon incompatibility domain-containing protein [Seiridium unicorne]|uniref:Heterokaryon incompatibility domain-containing protein n=1 Tax=Seiridium unicorne TaxID=138068 RepID=A0ABR2VD86_9PEZI
MEQVAKYHGDRIGEIQALCQGDLSDKSRKIEAPKDPDSFYKFPHEHGWVWDPDDYTLRLLDDRNAQTSDYPFAVFFQAWIFFGLIFTIVQEDGNPILGYSDLIHNNRLSTKKLHQALRKWSSWEQNEKNRKGLRFRMVQVTYILDLARQVVRKNCAYIDGEVGYDNRGPLGLDGHGTPAITDDHALILMCLGETLAEVTSRIIDDNHIRMSGWNDVDDQEGWGPPRYVVDRMNREWCPFTTRLLRGQMRSSAIMLVGAYYAYKDSIRREGHAENKCCAERCNVSSMNANRDYVNKHVQCATNDECGASGPDKQRIIEILEGQKIPIVKFRQDYTSTTAGPVELDATSYDPKVHHELVTISHVWSDGWGNENVNQLNNCQLRFIQRQVKRISRRWDTHFWMDTLVVPVGDTSIREAEAFNTIKKRAIRQIFEVFDASKYTIIIDNGLFDMNPGDKPAEIAMKVLASVWMRRLWTLQEAYLSRELHFTFKEGEITGNPNISLEEIERMDDTRRNDTNEPASGLTKMVRDQLSQITLGRERNYRNFDKNLNSDGHGSGESFTKKDARNVVTNVWRAVRWRTTGKEEHEVLALATLLNLEYEDTDIANAGLESPDERKNEDNIEGIEKLVKTFWKLLHKKYQGAIPSGIIFLPGVKVNIPGYGWAPRTLLSAHEVDYPDPMNFWNAPTLLESSKGLRVNYPGFILHTDSHVTRSGILGTAVGSDVKGKEIKFSFPVDRRLRAFYSFKRADAQETCGEITRLENSRNQLAIILSRQPNELPREIALLVEIVKESKNRDEDSDPDTVDYCIRIIHRIYIWRERDPDHEFNDLKTGRFGPSQTPSYCLAEMLGPNQRWWIDGYHRPRRSKSISKTSRPSAPLKKREVTRAMTMTDRALSYLGFYNAQDSQETKRQSKGTWHY